MCCWYCDAGTLTGALIEYMKTKLEIAASETKELKTRALLHQPWPELKFVLDRERGTAQEHR